MVLAANGTDATTALVVASIGLLGVAVGGVGNFMVQALVSRSQARGAKEVQLQEARAASLAPGEALLRSYSISRRLEQERLFRPMPSWLTDLENQWQARRELIASHVSPNTFSLVARGFTAVDTLNRSVRIQAATTKAFGSCL